MLSVSYRHIKGKTYCCVVKKHYVKDVLLSIGIRVNQVCGSREDARRRRL